ncbi:MAG: hypothetical protein JXR96_05875 [Deltaproteobacteria bacterium]|nr:hypothetical protein [Deltaproteobacteria bacterium]
MQIRPACCLPLLLALAAIACRDGWDMADPPFVWEPWPDAPVPGIPRPEHPRPDLRRQHWLNLNGEWSFQLDPDDVGLAENWSEPGRAFEARILVPFPWTSRLSGIDRDTGDQGAIGWYRRSFSLPEALQGRPVHLVVGAADWHTSLFINGHPVAEHDDGYLPFRSDITPYLEDGDNELVLRVQDVGNDAEHPHGKQGSPWYAHVGGVWQTVYLERAATTAIRRLALYPLPGEPGGFELRGEVEGPLSHCVLRAYAEASGDRALLRERIEQPRFSGLRVQVPDLSAWSPADPQLARLEFRLRCDQGTDALRVVAGWRRVSRQAVEGQNFEAVHLNGEPVYIRGVLVQGYHPDGTYSYPDEETIIADLEAAKRAGYNLVRLHIKAEEARLLYHADRLGLLVDADVPCNGIYPFLSGDSPESRERWGRLMEGLLGRDANHPSILWWTLFNETWGLDGIDSPYDAEKQAFVKEMLARARSLDPSRLVEDNSTTRYDHVSGTDINSFHLYGEDPADFEAAVSEWTSACFTGSDFNFVPGESQDGAPLLNTEYGPFSIEPLGEEWRHDRDISWGLRILTGLFRRHAPVVGYVFTELYDVEFEHNGLLDYDRTEKELGYPDPITAASINAADFVGFDEPFFQIQQGEPLIVSPFVSRWSGSPARGQSLRLTLFDQHDLAASDATVTAAALPFQPALLEPVPLVLPPGLTGPAYVLAEWLDAKEQPVAVNYLPGEIVPLAPPDTICDAWQCSLLVDLAACAGDLDADSTARVEGHVHAVGVLGEGLLRCTVEVPAQAQGRQPVSVVFSGELAANTRGAPQTVSTAPGSAVAVTLDGQPLGDLRLPPDRADSRGILSHLNGPAPRGGYGDWLSTAEARLSAGLGPTASLAFQAAGGEARGIILYNWRLGRYGSPARLVVRW